MITNTERSEGSQRVRRSFPKFSNFQILGLFEQQMLFFVPLVLTSWILVPQLHLWHLCLTLSYLRKSRFCNRRIWHIIFCKSHGEHLCATSLSSAPISWLRYCKLQRFTSKFVACLSCSEILGASCRKCHVPGSLFLPSSIRSSVLTHVVRDNVAAVAQNKCREIRDFIWKLFGKNKYHQNHYMLIRSNTVKQIEAVNLQEVVCSVYMKDSGNHQAKMDNGRAVGDLCKPCGRSMFGCLEAKFVPECFCTW